MSTKTKNDNKVWVRPQLNKLGKLADVAPGGPGTTEGASGKS
jgi:hypothetical protein